MYMPFNQFVEWGYDSRYDGVANSHNIENHRIQVHHHNKNISFCYSERNS